MTIARLRLAIAGETMFLPRGPFFEVLPNVSRAGEAGPLKQAEVGL
jgi:hypothetical protein